MEDKRVVAMGDHSSLAGGLRALGVICIVLGIVAGLALAVRYAQAVDFVGPRGMQLVPTKLVLLAFGALFAAVFYPMVSGLICFGAAAILDSVAALHPTPEKVPATTTCGKCGKMFAGDMRGQFCEGCGGRLMGDLASLTVVKGHAVSFDGRIWLCTRCEQTGSRTTDFFRMDCGPLG